MNDNDHDRRDEIASAVLDGEATPAERALAADDPATADRIERLRRIRAAISEVPAPDSQRREQAIAAALGAAAGGTVTSLTVEREQRRVAPRTMRIAGVAAAVAVGFLVISLVAVFAGSGGDDDGDGDFATGEVTTESDPTPGDGAGSAEESDMAGAAALDAADSAGGDESAPGDAAEPETAAGDAGDADDATEEVGDGGDGAAAGPDSRVALEVILSDAPDVGEVDLERLVALASSGGDESPTGVGSSDEATACAEEIEAAIVGVADTAVVATVDGIRVVAVGTPAGVVVIELVTCTVIDG